jgi:hypothetical protein
MNDLKGSCVARIYRVSFYIQNLFSRRTQRKSREDTEENQQEFATTAEYRVKSLFKNLTASTSM